MLIGEKYLISKNSCDTLCVLRNSMRWHAISNVYSSRQYFYSEWFLQFELSPVPLDPSSQNLFVIWVVTGCMLVLYTVIFRRNYQIPIRFSVDSEGSSQRRSCCAHSVVLLVYSHNLSFYIKASLHKNQAILTLPFVVNLRRRGGKTFSNSLLTIWLWILHLLYWISAFWVPRIIRFP